MKQACFHFWMICFAMAGILGGQEPLLPQQNPEDALIRSGYEDYGKALQLGGEERESLLRKVSQDLERLRRIYPGSRPLLEYNLGTVYLAAEDFGKSIYHLKLASVLAPDDPRIQRNLLRAAKIAQVDYSRAKGGSLRDILDSYWTRSSPLFWFSMLILLSWIMAGFEFARPARKGFARLIAFGLILGLLSMVAWSRHQGWGVPREVVMLSAYNPRTGLGDIFPHVLQDKLNSGSVGVLLRRDQGWVEVKWKTASGWAPESVCGVMP